MGVYNNNKDGTRSTIANTIQVVDAPMEQFLSRGEFSAVTPNDVSADNKLVAENEVTKAVDTMPTASADLVGTIVQYVGTTTANYTNGYFYKCVSDGAVTPTYSWVAVISGGGGSGDMLASVYDPNGTVAQAGGIKEYVEGEIADALDIQKRHYNLFDYTDIIEDYYRETALNSSIESRVSHANGWCSGQIWEVKRGDIIYTSIQWFGLLIYDENGRLVEYASNSGEGLSYTVTNDNAKYLTIQASARNEGYLYKLMISINYPLPNEYHAYADIVTTSALDDIEAQIPTDGKAQIEKGFVIISFDDFNLSDERFNIVNEYGLKASGAFAYSNYLDASVYDALFNAGWDCHLYSGYNWPSDNSYYTDAPSTEIQTVWDNYVKATVDLAKENGVYNATAWGARQGKSCVGLENACKKYGIKMIRGKNTSNSHDRYQSDFNFSTSSMVSLIPSKLNDAINACTSAANNKYGLVFTTHGLYATTEEAETNYGLTETNLRQFLTAVKNLVDAGTLEVLTFSEVYRKYYANDAANNDYDRLTHRIFRNNLPSGGTTGQVLVKSSDGDYDAEWGSIEGSADIDGVEPIKDYVSVTPIVHENKAIRINSSALIDSNYYNVAEVAVTEGEIYTIVTTTNSTAAQCIIVDDNDNVLYSYPSAYKTNGLVLTEGIEVTIPSGGVKMYSCISVNDSYVHSIHKVVNTARKTTTNKFDVLYNKKWYALGDSFTWGYFNDYTDSEGHTGQFSDAFDNVLGCFKTYPWWIQKRCGIKANLTLSMGGIDFTNITGAKQPFASETAPRNYTMIPNDCDYITLAFGLNEWDLTTEQIGTSADTTNETLWGAYNVVLTSILTNNPKVKIGIIITDAWMSQTYHDALIEIAKYWGIPYLDLKNGEQIPMMIDGELREHSATAAQLRDSVFQITSNNHPTLEGHKYRSTVIENFLRSL